MGNEISQTLEGGEYGWRILKIMPNSPCGSPSFGLVPYFDVVTHVNGVQLGQSRSIIVDMIKDSEPTRLAIFNISTKHTREITVIPNKVSVAPAARSPCPPSMRHTGNYSFVRAHLYSKQSA